MEIFAIQEALDVGWLGPIIVAIIAAVPATIAAWAGIQSRRTADKLTNLPIKLADGETKRIFTRIRSIQWASIRPMWETDAHGHVVWCNEAYMTLQTGSMASIMNQPWVPGNVDPLDEDRLTRRWNDAVRHEIEFGLIVRFKDQGWWSLKADPVYDLNGHLDGWVGSAAPLGYASSMSGRQTVGLEVSCPIAPKHVCDDGDECHDSGCKHHHH